MLRLLSLALILAPLAGCPAPAPVTLPEVEGPVFGGAPAVRSPELDEALARWEAAGYDTYRMTLQRICFCPSPDYTGPFEVTVRNGAVQTVRLNGAPVESERGVTVADLFQLIEEAYERDAARVDVAFDDAAGYPTSVSIDYSMQMADEEIGYRVSDLEPADR